MGSHCAILGGDDPQHLPGLSIRPNGFMLWTIVSERDDPPETQHPGEGSVAPRFMGRGSSLGIAAALCDGRLRDARCSNRTIRKISLVRAVQGASRWRSRYKSGPSVFTLAHRERVSRSIGTGDGSWPKTTTLPGNHHRAGTGPSWRFAAISLIA